ncbi:MAG: ELM1/GtrOC1 family putative glycosyltransferase [Gammaproteobacteria bacterium]|jgi:mitochondrial fission protein ELM1
MTPLRVWRFHDHIRRHEKQSLGLLQGLAKLTSLSARHFAWPDVRSRFLNEALNRQAQAPDLVIGAGRRVQMPVALTALRWRARSVILGKPSLPRHLFDLLIVPEHDHIAHARNVIRSRGVLSPSAAGPKAANAGMILVGGDSAHYGFDPRAVSETIRAIMRESPNVRWTVADSRRTPHAMRELLCQDPDVRFVHWRDAGPDWLSHELGKASWAWVTSDSVSMLYEALTNGCDVGVIALPAREEASALVDRIRRLQQEGLVTTSESTLKLAAREPETAPLAEHTRCAHVVLERFFASRLAQAPMT